ncbi:GNAT family N-acetyltransferase [Evansella cellulosilytica]|uniref:GCN5-related N-acetyltransferase n=1 Tax=Evansella cellulosilytica (strain ATCC 21833 / DSM 2522 / FERM P-1141 / JCM 9156 / N-4) TaxID=649639 RepID=E6TWP9_EVAC2|nr:GNAT family N-acetyltransferase [Evansella cellulosilytica]ADU28732.1 GCN5-related N-acetyltransferase [Evansella cellulosilytica DSM 2522]
MRWVKEDFLISDDVSTIDLEIVVSLLSTTYWAAKRDRETIKKSIEGSVVFGLYHSNNQIGFARVVTDKATFSWVMDVVIDEAYRERKLGTWLMECILDHPHIKHTSFGLATKDAQSFYRKFNFYEEECMRRR